MFGVIWCFSSPIQKEEDEINESISQHNKSAALTPNNNSNNSNPGDSKLQIRLLASTAVAAPSQTDKPKPTLSNFNQILHKSKSPTMKSTPDLGGFSFSTLTPVTILRKKTMPFEEKLLA